MPKAKILVKNLGIESKIYDIRNHRVIMASDLAELYGVETKVFNQAVRRNVDRFPESFMFKLTKLEAEQWRCSRSQNVTLKRGQNIKYLPNAFTEHGVLMAANILNSKNAVDISIQIIEAFVNMRKMLTSYVELSRKLTQMEKKYDKQFQVVFEAVKQLMVPSGSSPKQIGFGADK